MLHILLFILYHLKHVSIRSEPFSGRQNEKEYKYVYSHTKDFYMYVYLYTKHNDVKYIFLSICTIIVNTMYSKDCSHLQ